MYQIRRRYEDLAARKQQLIRNKWKADFGVRSNTSFYYRLDNPNPDDLKYFSVVFNCKIDDLVGESEVSRKARPLDELLKDAESDKEAAVLGLSK